MDAIDVIKNVGSVVLIMMASLSYCYFISTKLPKGIFRFISLIPIFIIFNILPFHLCSALAILPASVGITWLCSFKLLLFAFGQGPLSNSKSSLTIFICLAFLPIVKLKENKNPPMRMKYLSNLAVEVLFFALVVEVLIHYGTFLSAKLWSVLFGIFIFLLVDIQFSSWFVIGETLTGMELENPSRKPFLSRSLQEFWGRWSVPVSDTLRQTIYIPVRTASENVLGKGLAPSYLGVMAVFLVSGVMHELLYYHISPSGAISWEVTLFFVINGVVMSVEIVLNKKFKGMLRLPWFVSGPLTIGFVLATSHILQFPHMIRNGVAARILDEFKICEEYFRRLFHELI